MRCTECTEVQRTLRGQREDITIWWEESGRWGLSSVVINLERRSKSVTPDTVLQVTFTVQMTLNISSCCFITLTSYCWISIRAWHETTRMTRGQAPLPLQSTDRAGSGQVQSVHYRPTVTRIRTLLSRLSLKWPPPRYKTMRCSLHLSDSDKPPSCGHVVCSNYPAWACSLYSESRAE